MPQQNLMTLTVKILLTVFIITPAEEQ